MGMDQYFRAKTTVREYKGATGYCGGMFPMAPSDNGMVEIGYLRKGYAQDELMSYHTLLPKDFDVVLDDTNGRNLRIPNEDLEQILNESKHILETHTFDEDGYDVDEMQTYNCKGKWKEMIKIFTEAINILKEDPNAEIYYNADW